MNDRRQITVALGLLAALSLGACSSGSGGSGDSGAADMSAPAAADGSGGGSGDGSGDDAGAPALADRGTAEQADGDAARESTGIGADPAVLPAATTEQLARRASMSLRVKNIGEAAAKVRSIAATSEGIILSENIGGSSEPDTIANERVTATTYGEIAISVPSTRLDATLDEIADLGTLLQRDSSSENVSTQIVDTSTRTKTMQASVDRIRALMAQTTDIEQVVQLENELSRRTADLESLKAQLAALEGSVARSPIRLSLTTDTGIIEEDPGTGFLAGLAGGWRAFTGSVVVVLTVLGALLPFLVVLAAVGIPVWMVVRRRRTPRVPAVAAAAVAAPQE